jgi:hypothetical protein
MSAPRLADIFPVLDAWGIRYCLLRGGSGDEPAPGDRQEVDLLVAPDDAAKLGHAVELLGFIPLPMWGYQPHHSHIAYDAGRGWLKLDAVTDLRFGRRVQPLRIDLIEECLARRRGGKDGYRPAPEHELVLLLLHCLLDKEAFPTRHQARLAAVRMEVLADPDRERQLKVCFERHLEPGLSWHETSTAIAAADWPWLLARRRRVLRELMRRAPFATGRRWARARILLALRPLLIALQRRGSAVAILRPAGAGRSALAQALVGDRDLRARVVTIRANGALTSQDPRHARLAARLAGQVNLLLAPWMGRIVGTYHRLRGRLVIYDLGAELGRHVIHRRIPGLDLGLLIDDPVAKLETQSVLGESMAHFATEFLFEHDRKRHRLRSGRGHGDHRPDQR